MGKELKEKYERVCAIKDKALSIAETQLNGDISQVDAKELGEVVDIAKDMAELMKYMEEACYYHKVSEAMDEGSEEEKKYYLNKYIPEYEGKFYTPMPMARGRDSRGRYMYTEPIMMDDRYDDTFRDRMYYSSMNGSSSSSGREGSTSGRMNYTDMHDYRDGRSYMARRGYMEAKEMGKDKEHMNKELDKYMEELSSDMTEMIHGMDASEKQLLKQKLATLASKIS